MEKRKIKFITEELWWCVEERVGQLGKVIDIFL